MNSAWTLPKERPHIDDLATLQYQEKCSKSGVILRVEKDLALLTAHEMLEFAQDCERVTQRVGKQLSRFFQQRYGQVALLDHFGGNFDVFDPLVAGQVIHQIQHQFFQNHA